MECDFCFRFADPTNPSTLTKRKGWIYSTTIKDPGPPLAYAHNVCVQAAELKTSKPRSRLQAGTTCHFCDQPIHDQDKPRMLTTAWIPSRGLRVHLPSHALGWAHNDCVGSPPPQDSLF